MALTGIQIFKLLPKTNCGKCGIPTCLAFAMNLAAGKVELIACPFVSEESKVQLAEASAPPIRPVIIGTGTTAFKIGGETVIFRHEKKFENPTGIAVLVTDAMSESEVAARIERFNKNIYVRVGLKLHADAIAVKSESGNPAKFGALVETVAKATDAGLILMSDNPEVLAAGLKICAARKPLIYAATKANAAAVAKLAKENSCPVAVNGANLEEVAELTGIMNQAGIKDIMIDSGSRTVKQAFQDEIIIRDSALQKKFKPLGYPTITFPCEMTANPMKEALIASMFVAKYAGIVVLSDLRGEVLLPLLVERLNIFTDPQRPLATTPGIYEINNPNENSPVLITTNFSLTYFIVSSEIENSGISAWLLVPQCEGMSVLTAWAAGKFSGAVIGKAAKEFELEKLVTTREIVIPGYVAQISGELEENMPGWKVAVGPQEAADLESFVIARYK